MRPEKPPSRALAHNQTATFRRRLLAWYDAHARELPWRESHDPYRVWLSEIMLQQTRVTAVIGHYHEFLRRFPTVHKLAAAREASVLAAWSGLGYYRRARMMHAAAKVIARELRGKFPQTAEGLRELPGIGRYTAAAIASIAFGEPVAVVDGNVERVVQRLSGRRLAGEELWQAAGDLLDRNRAGDFNQAMMELGAMVCTPRSPECLTCPVFEMCAARGELAVGAKPAPQKKREIHYALHLRDGRRGGEVFLVQRARDASLMASMWELPEVEAVSRVSKEPIPRSARNDITRNEKTRKDTVPKDETTVESATLLFKLRHSITVTDYTVHVWKGCSADQAAGKWIPSRQLARVAMTGLACKVLRKLGLLAAIERQRATA